MAIPSRTYPVIKPNGGLPSDAWYKFLSDLSGGDVTASNADALNGQTGAYYLSLENATGPLNAAHVKWNVRNLSADATAAAGDWINMDATAGSKAVTIPAAASNPGLAIQVTKIDSSANTVTANAATLINGLSSFTLSAQYDTLTIESNGNEWVIT